MMRLLKNTLGRRALILSLLGLILSAGTSSAQVPFDMSYQGRLTDSVGSPLIGLVNLQMRIYGVIAGGDALYIEDHSGVTVDDVGAFSVRLGAGSALLGTFDTALFAGINRYLEVVVDGEVLAPRLVMGSVPYAMHADNAESAQATADAAQSTADGAQVRVSGSCAVGSSIRSIAADGSVTCETDDDSDTTLDEAAVDAFVANNNFSTGAHTVNTDTTYSAGPGITLAGTTFSTDTAVVQARVSGNCAVGEAITAISSDGAVTCGAFEPLGSAAFQVVDANGTLVGDFVSSTTNISQIVVYLSEIDAFVILRTNDEVIVPSDGPSHVRFQLADCEGEAASTAFYSSVYRNKILFSTGDGTLYRVSDTTDQIRTMLSEGSHSNCYANVEATISQSRVVDLVDPASLNFAFPLTGPIQVIPSSSSPVISQPRFEACGDGLTVADSETGLLWERKTGTVGAYVDCATVPGGCPDPNHVNNRYSWSNGGSAADGGAYTNFLTALNSAPGFADQTDWRLPIISELQSILVGPGVLQTAAVDPLAGTNPTTQATTCGTAPCADPEFALVGGPTASVSAGYWSASTNSADPLTAWNAHFENGAVSNPNKPLVAFVRAVRTGSCNP